ncbi:MAG: UDP-galactopyranose mutase [Methanobacteriaceae archaeon]|jgi:UDP-galactopyranose mutase|nr:UDP-galactopyranose mutase [Methanobacteriaceae archaeon]
MKYKYVIIGAGLSGITIAERIANELNEKVLIIEKRPHIGGNVYDSYNEDNILIQNYGPHIFHTNEKQVYDYLSNFTEWIPYEHKVLSSVDGKLVPMPICIDTLNELYDLDLDEEGMRNWIEKEKVPIKEIKSSEDVVLANAGRDIYEKLFKNYTEKQWGTSAKNLDSSVISRIPFRFNHDTRYFEDKYQGIPKDGYTKMCEKMLESDNIKIKLNTDYKNIIDDIEYDTLIYTGPIDYFYDFKYGKLLYRSLKFITETYDEDSYQEVAVVNYPNDYDFTRITEFKKLTFQDLKNKTTIMKEYPGFEDEPCYPYPTQEYLDKFQNYKKDMDKEENIIFLGRLAQYKYYNMDLIVKNALDAFEDKIKV